MIVSAPRTTDGCTHRRAAEDSAQGEYTRQLIDTFYSRTDCWPYQWYSAERQAGGYAKACRHRPPWVVGRCRLRQEGRPCGQCSDFAPIPVDESVIAKHLGRVITAGSYQLDGDNRVRWACLDFDAHEDFRDQDVQGVLLKARDALRNLNLPTVAEHSGGVGFRAHLWAFFLAPYPAIRARVLLEAALADAGLTELPFIERFPKQSRALNGYGNLVKVPFGVNRKTGNRSQFLDEDLRPVPELADALALIQPVDPTVADFTIDMKHLRLTEPTSTRAPPAKHFALPAEVMQRIRGRCWYFGEVERQQADKQSRVHYEDWYNYILMFARFGDAGVEQIMNFSSLDDRFDAYYTMTQIVYVRQRGYHAPSCRRLRTGPGLIRCPRDPLECGAA